MKLQSINDHGSHYWATATDGVAKCSVMIANDPNTRQWYVSGPNGARHYMSVTQGWRGAVSGARDKVRNMHIAALTA